MTPTRPGKRPACGRRLPRRDTEVARSSKPPVCVLLLRRYVKEGEMKTEYPIIIGGQNFGCGSSREHAPVALGAAGETRARSASWMCCSVLRGLTARKVLCSFLQRRPGFGAMLKFAIHAPMLKFAIHSPQAPRFAWLSRMPASSSATALPRKYLCVTCGVCVARGLWMRYYNTGQSWTTEVPSPAPYVSFIGT